MNRPYSRWALLLAAGTILLTGCGTATTAATATSTTESDTSPGMAPGMVRPDGSVMGAAPGAAKPPALAAMVCGDEVRGDLTKVLTLPAQRRPRRRGSTSSIPAPTGCP